MLHSSLHYWQLNILNIFANVTAPLRQKQTNCNIQPQVNYAALVNCVSAYYEKYSKCIFVTIPKLRLIYATSRSIFVVNENYFTTKIAKGLSSFKGIIHPKMKILSLFIRPHVIPNPFVVRKENKIMTSFNNFFSSVSVFDAFMCIPLLANKARHIPGSTSEPCLLHQQHHTHVTVVNVHQRLPRKRRNCWIKSLFLFSLCTKSILVAVNNVFITVTRFMCNEWFLALLQEDTLWLHYWAAAMEQYILMGIIMCENT